MNELTNRNRRCVLFTGTLGEGGAQKVISILTQELLKNGYQIKVLLYYDNIIFHPLNAEIGIDVVEKDCQGNIVAKMLWMRKYFKEYADLVISFLAPYNMLALAANIGTGIPIVVADRNDPRMIPENLIVRKLRDAMYHLADGVIVQTKYNLDYFSSAIQRKSAIIFNPVELEEKRALALRMPKKKKIVTLGRLMPQKNQILLIEAFAQIRSVIPEYELVIYGEGPQRKVLEERIRVLNLTECVTLPGATRTPFDTIANSALFVLSSDFEGMPNALIEAMCLGLPVISTKVSGATDLITDGWNGELTEVGNKQELAEAMLRLLQDETLCRKYAENAVQLNDQLSVKKIAAQWMQFLEMILQKTKRRI